MAPKKKCRLMVEDPVHITVKTCTEIDLKDRVIRKTWKLMGFALSKTYELDKHVAVQIKDKSMILEGYHITSFGVYLTSKGRKIRIVSTDDFDEARRTKREITEFLKEFAVKCPADMNAATSGAKIS